MKRVIKNNGSVIQIQPRRRPQKIYSL